VRFQVSQVMDAIEQRLTTDVTGAQAVVDLEKVVRLVDLDGGRAVNLVRIGMVVDALGRYLLDGGALLYGVVERTLLSEGALTSKERMVLSRWVDDGVIEATTGAGDRAVEIAELTGLPLIIPSHEPERARRCGRLSEAAGFVLGLTPRSGAVMLIPVDGDAEVNLTAGGTPAGQAVGRAKVPAPDQPEPAAEPEAATGTGAADTGTEPEPGVPAGTLPLPVEIFTDHGPGRAGRIRVSRQRYQRAVPEGGHAVVASRQWRCDGFECPAFGEHRRIGQPVPRMRGELPVCPRHDEPVADTGPRPPSYAVSVVIDDLPRQRLVVRGGVPVQVGRAEDPEAVVSVARWLHRAAAQWVSPVHLRLEARDDGLVVTDLSTNGTVVWQRSGPDDPGTTRQLRRESYPLGEWDSVELYTGVELVRGDRRRTATAGPDGPASVLVDAPTAAHPQVTR
jgi:hypothetical protein